METVKIGEREYAVLSSLCHGDYGGSGTMGEANLRSIDASVEAGDATFEEVSDANKMVDATKANPENPRDAWQWPAHLGKRIEWIPEEMPTADVLDVSTYTYGHREYWIRCDDGASQWCKDTIAALEDYPLLDDDVHSEVEREWEEESLPDVRRDLIRTLSDEPAEDGGPSRRDRAEDMPEETIDAAIYAAMEAANVYWEHENASAWLDTERLAPYFRAELGLDGGE